MDLIKKFSNGFMLAYDSGRFDDWCVYLYGKSRFRKPLTDKDYCGIILKAQESYPNYSVYSDFKSIYDKTEKVVDSNVLDYIDCISEKYVDMQDVVNVAFTAIYATMIAEQNKAYTKLGKRIKLLGVYTLLIQKQSLDYSMNFMRGMSYIEIENLCNKYNLN